MAFSVLMSVYSGEKPGNLSKSLDSVIDQVLSPDEIVLIKDGPLSTELESVIEEKMARYSPFVIYQFEENVKLGRALAKGLELCQYELVARMDSDDVAVLDRFSVQYEYMMKNPNIVACGGWIREFSTDGNYCKTKEMPVTMVQIRKYARYRNPLNHMTVMFRKEAVLAAGNYRHYPFLEDYDLWLRMISKGNEFANLPMVLVEARTEENIYERRGGKKYCANYMKLRKQQYAMGLLKKHEYLVVVMLTLIMTLQPSFSRKYMYRKILRKQDNGDENNSITEKLE